MKYASVVPLIACLLALSCTETYINGPLELTDPSVKPTVIYTFPPMNSTGPYDPLSLPSNSYLIQIRFNKIMDIGSVKRSISVSSSLRYVRTDSNLISGQGETYYAYVGDSSGYIDYYILDRARIGERFTVTVATGARDVNGNSLDREFKTSFVPEPHFRVKTIYPQNRIIDLSDDYGYVLLRFNSPLPREMFTKLTWTPPVSGRWISEYWDSAYVSFQFDNQRLPDTIVLSATTELRDIYGNALQRPLSETFTRVGFKILRHAPYYGASIDESIFVQFTEPIDSTTMQSAFHIEPAIPGVLSLKNNGTTLVFDHLVDFLQETVYSVLIDTSIRSRFGGRIGQPYIFSFRSGTFEFRYSSPDHGEIAWERKPTMRFDFNASLDTGSISQAFSISPPAPGVFSSFSYPSAFYFTPDDSLAPLTMYTVTISTALRTRGGTYLPVPSIISFITGP